jgi:hypothetical protein
LLSVDHRLADDGINFEAFVTQLQSELEALQL